MLVAVASVALLVVAAVLVLRRTKHEPVRVLAEAVPPAAEISGDVDPMSALDALLAELERTTVRIEGADELDESAVAELERLADKLEAAAAALERVT
jgi:exonuclease VII small subunit